MNKCSPSDPDWEAVGRDGAYVSLYPSCWAKVGSPAIPVQVMGRPGARGWDS
jgi:hypothetical protein